MAISVDYSTFVISIPKADLTLISSSPTEVRELDIEDLRTWLHDEQDNEVGITFPTMFEYTPPLQVSSSLTLSRVLRILPPYTITLENGTYNANIVGGNSNVGEVINKNSVGVNTSNSAGLQDTVTNQVSQIAQGVWSEILEGSLSSGDVLRLMLSTLTASAGYSQDDNTGELTVVYRDFADSKDRFTITYSPTAKDLDNGNVDPS